jgi:DNA-binding NtrC family response regulator
MLYDTEQMPVAAFHSPDRHLRNLRQIEMDVICLELIHYRGQVSKIARHLGIGRTTLYRKLEELGIGGNQLLLDQQSG